MRGLALGIFASALALLGTSNFRRALLNIDPSPDGVIDANDRRAILDLELV